MQVRRVRNQVFEGNHQSHGLKDAEISDKEFAQLKDQNEQVL